MLFVRPYTNGTEGISNTLAFDNIVVRGGGKLVIEGGEKGFNLHGNRLVLESGASLEADHLGLMVEEAIVEELSVIDLSGTVSR